MLYVRSKKVCVGWSSLSARRVHAELQDLEALGRGTGGVVARLESLAVVAFRGVGARGLLPETRRSRVTKSEEAMLASMSRRLALKFSCVMSMVVRGLISWL